MGYMKHEALVMTTWREDRRYIFDAFRDAMPDEFRGLLVGPIDAPMNGYVSWAFLPDGSKRGWDHSEKAHDLRVALAKLCDEEGIDWSWVYFGGDDEDKRHVTRDDGWEEIGA